MFQQPMSGSGYFKPAEAAGHLVLITRVHEISTRYDDLKGADAPIATVDLVDLDAPGQELRERAFVTHAGIINRLSVGSSMVLGRIGQAPTKSGNHAWVLDRFQEGVDDARAAQWVQANHQRQMTQPAPASAAPVPAAPLQAATPTTNPAQTPEVQALIQSLQP